MMLLPQSPKERLEMHIQYLQKDEEQKEDEFPQTDISITYLFVETNLRFSLHGLIEQATLTR